MTPRVIGHFWGVNTCLYSERAGWNTPTIFAEWVPLTLHSGVWRQGYLLLCGSSYRGLIRTITAGILIHILRAISTVSLL
jgi:hypothetical protein